MSSAIKSGRQANSSHRAGTAVALGVLQHAAGEQRFRLLADHAPLIVWEGDAHGARIYLNAGWSDLTGEPAERGLGARWLEWVHPEDREPLQAQFTAATAACQAFRFEYRLRRPTGEYRWMVDTAAPHFDAGGRCAGFVGSLIDITERRQSELAVRASEEKFRTLASHAPVGIFLADEKGDCTFVNDKWCAMAGLPAEKALGTAWSKALHPDDRNRVAAEWCASVREKRPFALEYRYLRPDGRVTWVQGSAIEFRDARGPGRIGTVIDITERKAADFALRESEKRFRTLASRAPVGIFMSDARGHTVFVNESWCALAGLTPEQAQGSGWSRAIHPDDRARVRAEWEKAVSTGEGSSAEFRFVHADGSLRWVQGRAVQLRDASGRLAGYVGTVADFTLRKSAEEKLRAQEAQLRLISTNAPIILSHCSRDGRFLFVNRAYAQRLNLRAEDIIGRSIVEMVGAAAIAVVQPYIDRVLAGEAVEFEAEIPYSGFGSRYMRIAYVPDIGPDGEVRGWLATGSDVTERRRSEEALRASETALQRTQAQLAAHTADLETRIEERTASLRDAIAQMEEFSYSVSHDLRSPLRAMNTYAQALVEDYGPQLDGRAREYLERIQRSSRRMEKLTHDVLTYSRLARTEMRMAPVDLEQLLRELIEQYAELQPDAAAVEIRAPLLSVRAHESSLGQALGNLLTNAAKFVRPGERPKICVSTVGTGEAVRICIQDDGIGIPPQYHGALFQVFERLPSSAQYEGTGIGLAIVRKAAEKMGGRYGVESDGTHGSLFWMELPKA